MAWWPACLTLRRRNGRTSWWEASWAPPYAAGSCRSKERAGGCVHRLPGHGQLWPARDHSGKISRPQVLPAQSASHTHAYWVEENHQLGCILAQKLNLSSGPVTVLIPLQGGSMIGAPGQPFHDAEADHALYEALKAHLRPDIPFLEFDCSINDGSFAESCRRNC